MKSTQPTICQTIVEVYGWIFTKIRAPFEGNVDEYIVSKRIISVPIFLGAVWALFFGYLRWGRIHMGGSFPPVYNLFLCKNLTAGLYQQLLGPQQFFITF